MSVTAEEFDDYSDEMDEGGLSGFYVLAIFLALLAAFLVIIYFAYEKGKATTLRADADLPVVAADPRPIREDVPLTATDTGRTEVYDRLEGNTPSTVIADADPARDPLDGYASAPSGAASTPADTTPTIATPDAEPAAATVVAAATPARETPKPTPQPAPARTEPVRAAAPTPAPAPVVAAAGTHVVQVGAFGSDAEAMAFYKSLSGKMGSLVSGKSPDVQVAEVKGKTYHRLRLAPFSSKAAANGYCSDLKAKGQDCLVKGV